MTSNTIGVDISKDHLDVHCLGDGRAARFGNGKEGFRAFEAWLPKGALARIVYEATGPYHAAFETRFATRYPLVKVNPLQARRFAQSKGTRAKTDAVDARMLAQMGWRSIWNHPRQYRRTCVISKRCRSQGWP